MPPDLYDPTDKGHPLLVLARDDRAGTAEIATRTTRYEARGPRGVPHPPSRNLHLDRFGWWRVDEAQTHWVPYTNFDDPDVKFVGYLDDETWERVQDAMYSEEDPQ